MELGGPSVHARFEFNLHQEANSMTPLLDLFTHTHSTLFALFLLFILTGLLTLSFINLTDILICYVI